MGDPDLWDREFARRIAVVEGRADLGAEAKQRLLRAVIAANRGVMADLRDKGHGAAVEAVEGIFGEALGEGVPS